MWMRGEIAIFVSVIVAAMIASCIPAAIGDEAPTNVSVNNVAPDVVDVSVSPSYVALNPCPDSTPILVEAEVSDDNGPDDISTVQVTAIENSSGGDASEYLEESLPVDMTYNESTGKYEATLHLKCTTLNDTYTVEVTAEDKGGLEDVGTGNFAVGMTCAIEIDFNAISFGEVNPGAASSVDGDSVMETVGTAPPVKPTIKNCGNAPINVSLKIEDSAGNPTTLFEGNTTAVVDDSGPETLSNTPTEFAVNLLPGNTTNLDISLYVPVGTTWGSYTGTLTIEPVCM
ncbi:MAG: hypothetical protein OCU22_01945 [Canidatus Methanoxibalbensis ujae]|nr:hypothetical protein [Candidatus Methanoxibalbensis ujae]